MGTIVSQVINGLTAVGIRSDEAYPGRRIPALTGAVAAVHLGKVDRSVRSTSVQVVIMSPASAGGSLCESTALRAVEAIQVMNGTCVKDVCKFDEMADVFYVGIEAEFFGIALADDWSSGPGYTVILGSQPLEHVVSFEAGRKIDDEITSIGQALWQFTIEELLPPGTVEPADPEEPFAVTLSRSSGDELFTNCTWTSVKREDTIKGVSQIRVGQAGARRAVGIL